MQKKIQVEAAVFDLDGTLTNTLQDIACAMNRALRLHDLPEFAVDEYRYLVGDGAKTLAKRAVRDRQELAESVQKEYQAYYEKHTLDTTQPYAGIPELLHALVDAGIRVCVLSNKPHADTCGVVRHFFPEIPFSVVQGQIDSVPVKPDPAGALRIARQLNIPTERFVYLGDTNVDMRTAVSAGMHAVGVTWGFRTATELLQHGAEILLNMPQDLLKYVTKL